MFNYKKLGFKAGLEIHQQLDGKKLFCNCPVETNKKDPPDFTFERTLHITEGESGKKDIAAEFEQKKQKKFIYNFFNDCCCLVETDSEPPHPLNRDALKIAIQVAKIINAKIVPEIQFMRKIVLDGSNITGFQRTALIARNGYIKTSKGKVNIPTIYLEEEAAKKIKETKDTTTYSLDRAGVPLIEVATAPDLKDAEHVKEVAGILGMILRSTEKVKRGIGSIRQDVNLSIKNKPRIELKGFQDLRSIPKVIELEIQRQLKEKDKESHVRKVEPNFTTSFLRPMPTSSRLYPETDSKLIEINKKLINSIKIPELISERAINFEKKYKLSPQYSIEIIKQNIPFDYYAEKYCIEPKLIAHTLIEVPKELKTRFKPKKELNKQDFDFIFNLLAKKQVQKDAILEILLNLSQNKKPDLSKYQEISIGEIESFIKDLVNKNPEVSIGGLMGDVMKKYKGSVPGHLALKILKKYHPK